MSDSPRWLRILMAEDDPDDRLIIGEAMSELDGEHQIRFAFDGECLLQALHDPEYPPHIVLMDLNMPRMTGLEALAAMKADPALAATPVIVFTTSREPGDIARSYRAGASGFVSKPETFRELLAVLGAIVGYWSSTVRLP